MKLEQLLSWRYVRNLSSRKSISTVALFSLISISISVFALTLATSIMEGFEKETKEKIQGINPDLISEGEANYRKFLNLDCVEAATPFALENIVISSEEFPEVSSFVLLKGIDLIQESKVSNLTKKFIQLCGKLELLEEDYLVLGKILAKDLDILVGEYVRIKLASENFRELKVKVLGFLDSGFSEYDSNLAITSLRTLKKLNPKAIEQTSIKTVNISQTKEILKKMGYDFNSWIDLYPALFSALKLEKWATFFVLGLMILISCINLIALLFMVITQKSKDIYIMTAMGIPKKIIRRIFWLFSFKIIFTAETIGLLFALVAGLLLQNYPFISLPDAYLVSTLPVKLSLETFIIIFFLTGTIGALSTLIALREIDNCASKAQ